MLQEQVKSKKFSAFLITQALTLFAGCLAVGTGLPVVTVFPKVLDTLLLVLGAYATSAAADNVSKNIGLKKNGVANNGIQEPPK